MSKAQEYINETIDLIDRMETRRPHLDNMFDIFEQTGNITLSEGVLNSYDASFIIGSLKKKFKLSTNINEFLQSNVYNGFLNVDYARRKPQTEDEIENGGKPINSEIVILEVLLPEGNYSERVEKFMNACGWYRAYFEPYGKKKGYDLSIFEKRLQFTEGVGVETDSTLYHLVPTLRVGKIMKMGLCPKSGCKLGIHPDRIYLFKDELSEREIHYWIAQLSATEKDKRTIRDGYTLLKINTEGLNIKFYGDPNLDGAVYTNENIPPQNIEIVKNYK